MKPRISVSRERKIFFGTSWAILLCLWFVWSPYYSEEALLDTSITSDVFGGMWQLERHCLFKYTNIDALESTTQRDRLRYLVDIVGAAVRVLNKAGLQAFLDSGTLLGWYRHEGKPIPWDIDADVGIIGNECREKYPDQSMLLEQLRRDIQPDYYHVEFFNCTYPPSEHGHDFSGIIVDTRNGFKVDIFAYNEVDTSNDEFSWRKGSEWLLRDDEFGRHYRVTPKNSVLPLQYGNFSGVVGNIIVNNPKERLEWDYGKVLDGHIIPYRLNMDVSMSALSFIITLLLMVLLSDYLLIGTIMATAVMFAGGIRVLLIALILFTYLLRNKKQPTFYLTIIVIASLIIDLSPILPQLFAHIMEILGVIGYRVNPHRFCFLHHNVFCIDY